MICKKCGNVIDDDAKFCTNCGAAVDAQDVNPAGDNPDAGAVKEDGTGAQDKENIVREEDKPEVNGKSGKNSGPLHKIPLKFVGIGAAVIVVICIAAFVLRKPTIELNDYVEITVNGFDGYGEAAKSFDDEKMIEDNADTFDYDKDADDVEAVASEIMLYEDADSIFSGTFDKASELSNGDKITFTWDIDKDTVSAFEDKYHCNLKYSDISYEVSGLEEIKEVDPFEENSFKMVYDGIAPDVIATAKNDAYPTIKYELSKETDISNGDVITVTASTTAEPSVEGFILSETSKDITVEGLDSYVNDISQIPEDYISQMESQAQDEMTSYVADRWNNPEWYQSMSYIGSYLAVEKPGTTGFFHTANSLYMVFEVSADSEEGPIKYYTYFAFDDLILHGDGSCSTDLTNCDMPNRYDGSFDVGDYEYVGFESLDDLYNLVIAANLSDYTVTDNMPE